MPKFAASLNLMFTEWSLLDRFAAARDAGFKAVEVQFPYSETPDAIGKRVASTGLELVLMNTPRGAPEVGGRGIAAIPGQAEEFKRSFETALVYMQATGCRMIHVMAGTHPTASEAAFEASLRHAAEKLAPIGGKVLLEPLNPYDNPNYFLGDFDLAKRIIDRLGLANVRLQYDFYHRQRRHGEIVASLTAMLPVIAHVQFAGSPGRHEPDEGEIDYGYLFATLDRLGYTGWVGAEYAPRAGTLAGLGWLRKWSSDSTGPVC
jgi:2-dehydrotetronate isomerase